MARTDEPHSATSQFFVNLKDNDFLDHRPGQHGYAVFGRVADGMDVIDRIAKVRTGRARAFRRADGRRDHQQRAARQPAK
jgi:cyclophilin family peptidyl-prolyl cis-trans isomerase